jgi:GNAT superfamily N-acetyltransferase
VDQGEQTRRQGEELSAIASEVLRIRRANLAEAEALTDLVLRSKAYWGYDTAFMAFCRAELTVRVEAIEGGDVWVAESEGALAGLLEVVPDSGKAEIRLIFVAPERMGEGIGGALWRHAEERARVLQSDCIECDADPNAVPFYERMGMEVIGQSPSGSIPGRMLPRMRKVLRK